MRTTIPGSRTVAAAACALFLVNVSGCATVLRDPQSLSSVAVERAVLTVEPSQAVRPVAAVAEGQPDGTTQARRAEATEAAEFILVAQTQPSPQPAPPSAEVPAPLPETAAGAATPLAVVGDLKPIGRVTLDITPPPGDFPPDHASARFLNEPALAAGSAQRQWGLSSYAWTPPAMCHEPLYFEERGLERHGQHVCKAQPLLSAVHFFGRIPALPYLLAAEPPGTLVTPLGQHRPGSRAPCDIELPPADLAAALVQGGVITGLFLAVP